MDAQFRFFFPHIMPDAMQKMCFAKADSPMNKERIVRLPRLVATPMAADLANWLLGPSIKVSK